jgi:hypothetical protein
MNPVAALTPTTAAFFAACARKQGRSERVRFQGASLAA